MSAKPKTIDEYLALQSEENRAALAKLRKSIHSIVPNAEECISYGIPAFRLDGKVFLHIGAAANHFAVYGMAEKDFADELADYDTSGKGTIRFPPDRPLPVALLRKMVKARIAKNAARRKR